MRCGTASVSAGRPYTHRSVAQWQLTRGGGGGGGGGSVMYIRSP